MAQILILAQLCDPSSELQIAERFYEASAFSDLLGVPAHKVNEDRLYRALDQLLPHKEELERHLKNRLGELFDLDYDLLLYDVTSAYFEGEAQRNGLAQRGYSRDHRPDCKQVNLALVVSRDGMPLGYQSFAGNRNDVTTLEDIVERVQAHIRVCFLAYVLWKTLAQLCQRAGLGNEPRKVFQELADITLVDVVLPTRNGVTIRKRCINRPTEHQAILLQHLNLHLPTSLELAQVE